jgi:hypothetical protein
VVKHIPQKQQPIRAGCVEGGQHFPAPKGGAVNIRSNKYGFHKRIPF